MKNVISVPHFRTTVLYAKLILKNTSIENHQNIFIFTTVFLSLLIILKSDKNLTTESGGGGKGEGGWV